MLYIAAIAFGVVLAIGVFLYFKPKYTTEGFTTIAIDGETVPKCVLRDSEAQYLLTELHTLKKENASSADAALAYDEFKLIIQKLLCMDADITSPAGTIFATYQLPFSTSHDIEPLANFVGRCIRHSARNRDIQMIMNTFQMRGDELIQQLCFHSESRESVTKRFHMIVNRVTKNISGICIAPKATLDTPAGPRDPGYYEPAFIKELSPYKITGDYQYF